MGFQLPEPLKEHGPTYSLISAPDHLLWTSDLQNCNLTYGFMPPHVWGCVRVAAARHTWTEGHVPGLHLLLGAPPALQ